MFCRETTIVGDTLGYSVHRQPPFNVLWYACIDRIVPFGRLSVTQVNCVVYTMHETSEQHTWKNLLAWIMAVKCSWSLCVVFILITLYLYVLILSYNQVLVLYIVHCILSYNLFVYIVLILIVVQIVYLYIVLGQSVVTAPSTSVNPEQLPGNDKTGVDLGGTAAKPGTSLQIQKSQKQWEFFAFLHSYYAFLLCILMISDDFWCAVWRSPTFIACFVPETPGWKQPVSREIEKLTALMII